MARGGVSEALFRFFAYFMGDKRAGYPCAVIATCLFYGAISGSGPATTAAVGSMTLPILLSLNYDKKFSAAVVGVSGALGIIIPPSIPFIIYSTVTNVSTGDLFIAGILPGILIGICLMAYAYYYCIKNGEDRDKLIDNYNMIRKQGFLKVFIHSLPALLCPVVVLGSIYGGIASPTEAAAVSVFYSLIVSLFIYKNVTIKDLPMLIVEGIRNTAPILFIIACAVTFSRVITIMNVPSLVQKTVMASLTSKAEILVMINVVLLFVGMLMDTLPAIMIFGPIFYPLASAVGVDLLHFGIIMVVNLAIGQATPPMGINLFVTSSLTGIPVIVIAKKAVPFLCWFLIALILITLIPQISLILLK
jgi:C4-dicarboxylate transporter DctM subunit